MNYPYLLPPIPDSSIEVSPIEASGRTRSRDRGKLDHVIGRDSITASGQGRTLWRNSLLSLLTNPCRRLTLQASSPDSAILNLTLD
jgi:hypothetical protein